MRHPDSVGASDGNGLRKQIVLHGAHYVPVIITQTVFHRCFQGAIHFFSGFHHIVVGYDGGIVIAHHKKDLVGKLQLVAHHVHEKFK